MKSVRWILRAVAFLLLLVSTSCVNTFIKISFQTLETGTLEISYVIPFELSGMNAPGGRLLTQLPDSRTSLDTLVAPVQNLTVTTFTQKTVPGGRQFDITFRFATLRALEGLFVAASQRLTVLPNQGVYTLTQIWENLGFRSMDKKTKDLVTTLYGDSRVTWELNTPRAISFASEGEISPNRRKVTFSQTWNALWGAVVPSPWRVQW